MDFLHDNEMLYKKCLMDYKDRSKREAVWDQFCDENNLDKDACQRWFQSQHTLFGKVTYMKSVQGEPQLTKSLTCDPADMSHLDTHTPTPRSCGVSATSSLADFDLQSALMESQRGTTELKDIVAKKLTDDKPDNPRLGFCDFLKVEVVQLTSDLYEEFQQETFNLVMRLKRRDKQQQRCQHRIGMSITSVLVPWRRACLLP